MENDKQINSGNPKLLFDNSEAVDSAIKKAVKDALLKHKQANNPVAVWRDGQIVILKPEEIPV